MTRFQLHVEQWKDCTRCSLHHMRTRVVHFRGSVPCDVLFLGEAPGESEDVIGQPFIGPAGKLLDQIIERSIGEVNQHRAADGQNGLSYGMTNLVGCLPRGEDGAKTGEPEGPEIRQCAPRVEDLVDMCSPLLIINVGALARKWLDSVLPHRQMKSASIEHPASILRANIAQRGLAIQKAIVTIRSALLEFKDAAPF